MARRSERVTRKRRVGPYQVKQLSSLLLPAAYLPYHTTESPKSVKVKYFQENALGFCIKQITSIFVDSI